MFRGWTWSEKEAQAQWAAAAIIQDGGEAEAADLAPSWIMDSARSLACFVVDAFACLWCFCMLLWQSIRCLQRQCPGQCE